MIAKLIDTDKNSYFHRMYCVYLPVHRTKHQPKTVEAYSLPTKL